MRRRNFLGAGLALCSGCALMALGLQTPEVSVVGVEMLGGSLIEQRLRIKLRVSNPNDRAIALRGMSFVLDVGGYEFARGMGPSEALLPALGDLELPLNANSSMLELVRAAPRLLEEGGALAYRLRGQVLTRDYGKIPFDRSGSIKAADLLKNVDRKGALTPL